MWTLAVESSFFATITQQSCNHRLAWSPVKFMNKLTWSILATVTARPYFNCLTTADYGVHGKNVNDVGFVVDLAFYLPFADVLVTAFTSILNEYKFTVWADFFDAYGTFNLKNEFEYWIFKKISHVFFNSKSTACWLEKLNI